MESTSKSIYDITTFNAQAATTSTPAPVGYADAREGIALTDISWPIPRRVSAARQLSLNLNCELSTGRQGADLRTVG